MKESAWLMIVYNFFTVGLEYPDLLKAYVL